MSAPTQTGKASFPGVSASAQGQAKDFSSVLVFEFPWGSFTQDLIKNLASFLFGNSPDPKHSASKDDTDKNSAVTLKSNL